MNTIEEFWGDFTSSEKELFQKSCRRLLKQTFLVRDRDDDSRKLYHFTARNADAFSAYFRYIGFDIVSDRDCGVVMLRNSRDFNESGMLQGNHVSLSTLESLVLCCLWTIYIDKMRNGNLSKNIIISITDLSFELEKYNLKDRILAKKNTLPDILALFIRYQLLQVVGKLGDLDCKIILLPSMQFVLNPEEFARFVDNAKSRMGEKWKISDETITDTSEESV